MQTFFKEDTQILFGGATFQIDGTVTNEGAEKNYKNLNVIIYFKFFKVISTVSLLKTKTISIKYI